MKMDDLLLFEASFEVVNKVGGIHTVLASKAARMMENTGNYFAVGPYYPRNAAIEFEDEKPSKEFREVFDTLAKKHGIKCYSGHWLVTGRPKCVLVDVAGFAKETNSIKGDLWKLYGIDSLNTDAWFNDPVVWAKAAGIAIEGLYNGVFRGQKAVAHFHEWLAGAGLLHLKAANSPIGTVFTTHATMLGRSKAGAGHDLYKEVRESLPKGRCIDDRAAYGLGVQAKHLMEKACANAADAFTTVSDITAREAEYILCKKADVVLANGLDLDRFPLMEELANLHIRHRNHIREFVMDYFSPYYHINVEDTLFYFIAGRYEMRNKGIDMFIDALGKLNRKYRGKKQKNTIIAFVWVPRDTLGTNIELLHHLSISKRLEEEIDNEVGKIKERLLYLTSQGIPPSQAKILDDDFLHTMKKMLFELKSKNTPEPPLCAFEIDQNDEILNRLRGNELSNRQDDAVKVIYYPAYLSTADGLIGLDYYPSIMGCHLGIFPSYYEPWGYTPLETAALGLPSVTTDLSGFGRFIRKALGEDTKHAVDVLHRDGRSYESCVNELDQVMDDHLTMGKKKRGDTKIEAKRISYLCDWRELVKNYLEAYEVALKK